MSAIAGCGGAGAVCCAAIGGLVGGLPGAMTFGSFGAGIGLKIGRDWFGGSVVRNVANQALNKALDIADITHRYFIAGSAGFGTYWLGVHHQQAECLADPNDPWCSGLKVLNLAVAVGGVYIISQVAKRAIYDLEGSNPPVQRRGTALMEDSAALQGRNDGSTVRKIRKMGHDSVDKSANLLNSSF